MCPTIPGPSLPRPCQNYHPLETAYLYFSVGDPASPWKVFTAAPGLLGGVLSDLEVFGLLNLDPTRFGLAQVDVESGMHKNIRLAEAWQDDRLGLEFPDHPEIFDETTTLPSLRSGGFSLYGDGRALRLLQTFQENKQFNTDLEAKAPRLTTLLRRGPGARLPRWISGTRSPVNGIPCTAGLPPTRSATSHSNPPAKWKVSCSWPPGRLRRTRITRRRMTCI